MGKIRVAALGDEQEEKKQKKEAEARREAKKAKKHSDADVSAETASPESAPTEDTKQKRKVKARIRSKRYQDIRGMVDKTKLYSLDKALELVKKTSTTKFDGTVEMHVSLNPQTLGGKSDYRGSVILPHGTGKKVTVAIADDELIKQIEAGTLNFDILVAHPSMMPKLAKVARVLGPKGLMPNPKTGTVTPDPEKRAKELAGGEVNFKTEPDHPIVHQAIGKVSFTEKQLTENIKALLLAIGKTKISRITLTSTMGPGIKLDANNIL